MQYSTSFNELNINKFFLKRDEAITDFNMLANKVVEYEKNNLKKSTIKKQHYAEIAPIYLYLILGIACIFQVLSFAFILKESKTRFNY